MKITLGKKDVAVVDAAILAPTSAAMSSRDLMLARYRELCDTRDAANRKVEPIQKKLDAANARAMAANDEANKLAAEIENVWGGADWLTLKRDIAVLARALGNVK